MSTWKVKIRTDEGHKKWASVEAADAAGAIAASGAEAESVRSVKIEDMKRMPVPGIIAALGLSAYVSAIMFENWWTAFSGETGWMFFGFVAFFGLLTFLMRKQFITPSSDSQSSVTWFDKPGFGMSVYEYPVLRSMLLISLWIVLFAAMFFGYDVINNGGDTGGGGGEEAISALDVLMPILLFGGTVAAALEVGALGTLKQRQ